MAWHKVLRGVFLQLSACDKEMWVHNSNALLFQTHADVTLAKADAALRLKEAECTELKAENETLRTELTAVKQRLSTSTEQADRLHQEGQVRI